MHVTFHDAGENKYARNLARLPSMSAICTESSEALLEEMVKSS